MSSIASTVTTTSVTSVTTSVKGKRSSYILNRISKNNVSIEKFENPLSVLHLKLLKVQLLIELLLQTSQKLSEQMDALYFVETNSNIMNEHQKLNYKISTLNNQGFDINQKRLGASAMNDLQKFIYKTKSSTPKIVSIINLNRLSLLPAELILIIREYLPIEIRTQVLENTWNIPYIEYNERIIRKRTEYDTFYYDTTINELMIILYNCDGRWIFENNPMFTSIKQCIKLHLYGYSLYNYTVIFDAIILLIKSFCPKLAYTVLTSIKQKKIEKLSHTIILNNYNYALM